jgi:adenylylsulfate kinase-like enzyme
MIYFFTGQPQSAKARMAKYLKEALIYNNSLKSVVLIDDDYLKGFIDKNDFPEKGGGEKFMSEAITISKYLAHINCDVILSLDYIYRDLLDEFKENYDVVEVYIHSNDNQQQSNKNCIEINTKGEDELVSLNELLGKIQNLV